MTLPRAGRSMHDASTQTADARDDPPAPATPPILAAQALLAATAALALLASTVAALAAPEIRQHRSNRVPQCVTPERLMSFLALRNTRLDPLYRDIAEWYRRHGEALGVRWDYAFFQMVIETNYLTFRRPDGRPGDVDPRQNNFAGIGATGGGVAGDRFPDVATGVLAQIQHLVAYSGQSVAAPVAPRTALKQHDIIAASRRLARPVRFSDLARRWAADPRYGASIEFIAQRFRDRFCADRGAPREENADRRETLPWQRSSLAGPDEARAASHAAAAMPAEVIEPPQPRAARRPVAVAAFLARERQVVRTIWRRGDAAPGVRASGAALKAVIAPAAPKLIAEPARAASPSRAVARQRTAPAAAAAEPEHMAAVATVAMPGRLDPVSGLLGGLAGLAQSVEARSLETARTIERDIVAPPPSLAARMPR